MNSEPKTIVYIELDIIKQASSAKTNTEKALKIDKLYYLELYHPNRDILGYSTIASYI